MRIMTLTRFKHVILLAAVLALVPQFAFAQLPVASQEFRLQGSTSGALILKTAAATTDYTLTYPAAQGTVGSFLFLGSTDGTLKWSTAAGGDNFTPIWDTDAGGPGVGGIVWVDPAGATNPNWSLTGNQLAADGTLGSKNGYGVNFQTNLNTRLSISSDGAIGINATGTGGATTTIGRAAGHTTAIDGTTNVTGTTNINASNSAVTTIGSSGATNINTTGDGAVNVGTGASSGTVTVGRTGGTLTTIGALGHTGTATVTGTTEINVAGTATTSIGSGSTSGATTIGRSDGTTTVIGTTTINNNVNNNTSINTGSSTGTLAIGNAASTTNVLGTTTINNNSNNNTSINTGSSTGTVAIGNAASTTNILGATTINSSGSAATTIGNTDGGTSFTGPIKMAGDNGTSGEVLVSKGVNATPEWQNLTESIGIRKVGVVDVTNLTATAAITVAGLAAPDAIIVTLQTASGSTVVGTVTSRTNSDPNATPAVPNGSFVVTFSGRFTGSVNYMVIKALN